MVPPKDGQKVFVLASPTTGYITVHSTLYGFERKEDADGFLEHLSKEFDLSDVKVDEVEAARPFLYVALHPEIRFIGVKETKPK